MRCRSVAIAVCALAFGQSVCGAQPSHLISMREARARAIAVVPDGRIRSGELERERGRLVYSFDIVRPRRSGVEEVLIDAHTGRLASRSHETSAMERREARADARRGRNR
jgi:hypothetical protein